MYHVLHNPAILQRLRAELRAAWPTLENAPRYETLEKLPYLVCLVERPIALTASMWRLHAKTDGTSSQTAVIKEGLRMFPSAIAHPRVVPPEGAVISGSFIPGGVSRKFSLSTPPASVSSPRSSGSVYETFYSVVADSCWPVLCVRASVAHHVQTP
jgi:hypothetical protein